MLGCCLDLDTHIVRMRGEKTPSFVSSQFQFAAEGNIKALQTKPGFVLGYLLPTSPMATVWLADLTQRHLLIWMLLAIGVTLLNALGPSGEGFTYARLKGLNLFEIVEGTLPRAKLFLLGTMASSAVALALWIDTAYAPGIIIFLVITILFIGMAIPDVGQEEIGIGRKFLCTLLDLIPAVLIALAVAFFIWAVAQVGAKQETGDVAWLCAGVALAMSSMVTVGHTLAHGTTWARFLAKLYFSLMGYPHFVHEHFTLHGAGRLGPKSCVIAARISESFYSYLKRRLRRGWLSASEWQLMNPSRKNLLSRHEMPLLVAVSVLTVVACVLFAGVAGGMLWLLSCLFTHWSAQATNYLRHWGMTGRSLNQGATGTAVWEMNHHWDELMAWDRSEGTSHFRSPSTKYYSHVAVSDRTAPVYPYSGFVMRFIVLMPRLHAVLSLPPLMKWRKEGGRRGTMMRERKALSRLHERRLRNLDR